MFEIPIWLFVSCLTIVSVIGLPASDDSSPDIYEQRVKLLTGSTTPPTCDESGDDLGECLKRIFMEIQPRAIYGIPELNIPQGEPLLLNTTVFRFDIGPVSGRLQMRNAVIHGLATAELKKVDFKVEDGATKYKMEVFVPLMRIEGNYRATVSVNNRFNFKPQGTFNLTLHDVTIDMSSEGKIIEKDGHKFVRIHKVDADPKIGDMDVDVTGIFADPELNEFVVGLGKQYWREVYRVMLPETRDYWAPLVMRLLNESLNLLPYDAFVKN